MPEHDNDRLEQFFRKAAGRADVSFNEEDWKKLEARLDAADAGIIVRKKSGTRVAAAVMIATAVLLSGGVWLYPDDNIQQITETQTAVQELSEGIELGAANESAKESPSDEDANGNVRTPATQSEALPGQPSQPPEYERKIGGRTPDAVIGIADQARHDAEVAISPPAANEGSVGVNENGFLAVLNDETIRSDLTEISTAAIAERNKQKAFVKLPGAEEEDTNEAAATVEEEHASSQKKHVATPRLSLLLSYAPDFSSPSIAEYSAPGNAFGAVIHYHVKERWSFSAGVIKNFKQYTGYGEEYKPPKGYWKYYTNGIIPESIDGSCHILEFPVMVHYTLTRTEKNRWTIGAGASSYLMQSESYQYNFAQPNPGAKTGWDSQRTSRFLFNMVNFTVGYEHQVIPGLMIGIEPYAKIPLKEIGWSNLKLFSTGASVTLRYTILRKDNLPIPRRSRGPD